MPELSLRAFKRPAAVALVAGLSVSLLQFVLPWQGMHALILSLIVLVADWLLSGL